MDAAASWFLGTCCPTCGADAAGVCRACLAALGVPDPVAVPGPPGGPPGVAAHPYAGVWRRAVVAFKERAARDLAAPLGAALACAVAEALVRAGGGALSGVTLVPMPSRPAAVRSRGVDTTRLLARVAASALRGCGLPTRVVPALAHARAVRDQAGLSAEQRRANLAGALRTCRPVTGAAVVVDDLVTTGSSLAEAGRALRAAGTAVIAGAVVCAAPRRR